MVPSRIAPESSDQEEAEPREDRSELPAVLIRDDEARVNDEVSARLWTLAELYQRGGELVRVLRPGRKDLSNAPRIQSLPRATLRESMTKVVRFLKETSSGLKPQHPPVWCVDAVAARGTWPEMPVLRSVVEWPVLCPDGSVLQDEGFDEQTGLLFLPQEEFEKVADQPSGDEVRQALDDLLGLDWQDLDFEACELRIRGSKTKGSFRKLAMHQRLIDELKPRRVAGAIVEHWKNVRRDLAQACDAAKVPRVTPNDLRRTFASWLVQARETNFVVSRLLGHSTTKMVDLVYGQLSAESLRIAINKLPGS
jgi:hypothetical protein